MDLKMPVINGVEATKIIRKELSWKSLHLLVMILNLLWPIW
jgi:CheY-like chemotaxis protein